MIAPEDARFVARCEAVADLILNRIMRGEHDDMNEQMTFVLAALVVRAIEQVDLTFQETQHE